MIKDDLAGKLNLSFSMIFRFSKEIEFRLKIFQFFICLKMRLLYLIAFIFSLFFNYVLSCVKNTKLTYTIKSKPID